MQNYYYSGQGTLYVAKRDATTGRPMGFSSIGNVPELTIDVSVSKFEHVESESGNRLLDLQLLKERKGAFKMKMENITPENLALGLYGESAQIATGTITGEVVTAHLGFRCPLAHPDVSAVVVKDDTDTTTYTANTDYTLDAKNGVLTFLSSGTIVEGDAVHVNYTHAAYKNMEAFTQALATERWLRFEGLNTVDGSRVIVDAFRAQFDPLTNYGLINADIASLDVSGALLVDPFVTSGSKFFRQRNVSV